MKKFLSLAVFALCASAAMAQSSKATMMMQEGKFEAALPVIEAEIQKVTTEAKAASEKAAAKGKPFDASKFNDKYAGLYNQGAQAWAQVFTPELMHAAQNEQLDTARFISSLDKMVEYGNLSYQYDNIPNAKGKAKGKFNADNFRIVSSCLDYYFYAGYFLSNSDKAGAAKYFQKHLDLPNSPMFASKRDSIVAAKRENYEQCSYYACILNYELERYDEVLKGVEAGLGNPEYAPDLYFMKAESALKVSGDSAAYIGVIKEAVNRLEDNSRFCETLLGYYYQKMDAEGAHDAVDELIVRNNCAMTNYMKGCVYMNIEHKFPEAREYFEKALFFDPNDANSNGNMAFAYMNEGRERRLNNEYPLLDRKNITGDALLAKYNAQLEEFRGFFRSALPYMEKYRELQPEKSKIWAPALQQIYANLGMQAEADAMDEIMTNNARGL